MVHVIYSLSGIGIQEQKSNHNRIIFIIKGFVFQPTRQIFMGEFMHFVGKRFDTLAI